MDTTVTLEVVLDAPAARPEAERAIERGFGWFAAVEAACSRFDPASEVRALAARPQQPVEVSPLLWQAVRFALEVARQSGGAFDPTVGQRMETLGFVRNHRTGREEPSGLPASPGPSWRDVVLDARRRTILLRRPLLLDLGAVAKGLAVDLALRELEGFPGAVVEAGGDLAVRGRNAEGRPWRIGVRHPREQGALCCVLGLEDGAVCTSGDYERRAPQGGASHIVDPRGPSDPCAISCTVVAPGAMVADALGTAAMVLGPDRALSWLEARGVEALIWTPQLERRTTAGFSGLEVAP